MTELENRLLHFFKYQGVGNDFICIDNRKSIWQKLGLEQSVSRLCHRRYGIGADCIIFVQNRDGFDFQMVCLNSDGSEAVMCGNGARCTVAFAKTLGVIKNSAVFLAKDGAHKGFINPDSSTVRIKMQDVEKMEVESDGSCVLDTGAPHYVRFVSDPSKVDVVSEGRKIRYSETFKEKGINVNFVSTEHLQPQQQNVTQDSVTQSSVTQSNASHGRIKVCTYEKGVEDETFACGTGATAAAIAFFFSKRKQNGTLCVDEMEVSIVVSMKGGDLCISFDYVGSVFTNVCQSGPAEFVYEGKIKV